MKSTDETLNNLKLRHIFNKNNNLLSIKMGTEGLEPSRLSLGNGF